MQKAELYSRSSGLQRRDAKHVLDNFFDLVRCRSDGVYMDVGCGSGDVTVDLLLPLLPAGFRKLIGTDVAETMVQASVRKSNDHRVMFKTCNVADNDTLQEFTGQVDHIFSFYCLHWVQEQRTAYQNMCNMLRPGGDLLVAYLADCPIYDVYEALAARTGWASHMQHWRRFCSPFHGCNDVETRLRELLSDVGLVTRMCKLETRSYTYPSVDVLRKSVLAVVPFTKKMQDNEVDAFIDDYVSIARKTKNVVMTPCNNNNEEQVTLYYTLIVVCASKPL